MWDTVSALGLKSDPHVAFMVGSASGSQGELHEATERPTHQWGWFSLLTFDMRMDAADERCIVLHCILRLLDQSNSLAMAMVPAHVALRVVAWPERGATGLWRTGLQ